MKDFVKLQDITKIYKMGEIEIRAADNISFSIDKGEFVVIVGPSGAGKTTVLNILGGMDTATSGTLLVDGEEITAYNSRRLTEYRREDIGFVFQFYNLVPNLTALENVELALQICKDPLDARKVMEEVGLGDRLNNFPAQLSAANSREFRSQGRWRKIPNCFSVMSRQVLLITIRENQFSNSCRICAGNGGMTVIVITHNQAIAPMADRLIHIKNGQVSQMELNEHPMSIDDIEW